MRAPCTTHKHIHASRGKAQAALRALLKRVPEYSGTVYPCVVCHGWHIGRLKQNAHVSKYAERDH